MHTITLGRKPTLGEVIDYYTEERFLRHLLETVRTRRVVLVISERQHWEPNWEKDEVSADNPDDLRRWILGKVRRYLPKVGADERPDYYPAFHQSVWKGTAGQTPEGQIMDCIFEADLPSWRDAFQDVGAIIALLERYEVPYQHKFSGHRSLHIVIPGEAVPLGYRGKGTRRLAQELLRWSSSQAHHLPKITRMPYSLNEDTGLACLPIEPGELAAFRPWQANLHVVEVRQQAQGPEINESHQERLAELLTDLRESAPKAPARGSVHDRPTFVISSPDQLLARYRDRLRRLEGSGAMGRAWAQMTGAAPMAVRDLIDGLTQDDPDVAWLSAEAYVFHGTGITPQAFEVLLAQEEEYVQASAIDVLLQSETAILPLVVEALRTLSIYTSMGAKVAYLLTQSTSLRQAAFDAMVIGAENTHDARIVVACLTGAVSGDWVAAMALAQPVMTAQDVPPQERARLRRNVRALEIMRTLGGWNKAEEIEKGRRLAALGPAITDLLLMAANSPERRFRREIVSVLAARADPRATDALIRALHDDYTKVRQRAIAGLIRIGKPAVMALIGAADSDQTRSRRYALLCLARIAASDTNVAVQAKPVIGGALSDTEEVVRRVAIRAMVSLATPDDMEDLTAFLRGANPEEAIEAIRALESLGPEGAEALEKMATGERIPAAAYFLARQGDEAGREILVDLLLDASTRQAAVEFLRELRDPRCVPYLVEDLRASTDWHGIWLAQELGAIGGDAAVHALIEALSRDVHLIRRGAIRGLDTARDPTAIPALANVLDDPDRKVRRLATNALERFGEAAVESLTEALARTDAHNSRRRDALVQILNKVQKLSQGDG